MSVEEYTRAYNEARAKIGFRPVTVEEVSSWLEFPQAPTPWGADDYHVVATDNYRDLPLLTRLLLGGKP